MAKSAGQTASARLSALETRKDVLVGINKYPNLNEVVPKTARPDFALLREQFNARILFFDNVAKEKALQNVSQAITGNGNMASALKNAAAAGACRADLFAALGCTECDVLPVEPMAEIHLAEKFEELRHKADDLVSDGYSPRVFWQTLARRANTRRGSTFRRTFSVQAASRWNPVQDTNLPTAPPVPLSKATPRLQ
jgi:methylmalonyl-CoA mutase